jgi:hypothetical protein
LVRITDSAASKSLVLASVFAVDRGMISSFDAKHTNWLVCCQTCKIARAEVWRKKFEKHL